MLLLVFATGLEAAVAPAMRLYDGRVAYIDNPTGAAFTIALDVQDINHLSRAPAELMVKIMAPDGRLLVRTVLPDDGVVAPSYAPMVAGWDHEAWYYATVRSRGLTPMTSWSAPSQPARLASVPARRFSWSIDGGTAGVYRVVLHGTPDHYVKMKVTPELACGWVSTAQWLHGHGDQLGHSYLYVPQGTQSVNVLFLEIDQPATRSFTLRDPTGEPLALVDTARGAEKTPRMHGQEYAGVVQRICWLPSPGHFDDQLLSLDISGGAGDFLVSVSFNVKREPAWKRPNGTVNALFCEDAATALALSGGSIEVDGQRYWHPYQARLDAYLATVDKSEAMPGDLPVAANYRSTGSHNAPPKGSADRLMHSYHLHQNPRVLVAALQDMARGLGYMGPGDSVMHGPQKNLAYELGCYSFFFHRPAWRILQQTDAPEAAKAPLRDFLIMVGDRLAFCRSGELVNGNATASLLQALRYCVEGCDDAILRGLFDTYWERFTQGGFGERIGLGPSGGIQESFGYDQNYGTYVLRGWRSVIDDLNDPGFAAVYDRVRSLYSYTYAQGLKASPWSSRTSGGLAGGTYSQKDPKFPWRGRPGPDFTVAVNGHNEFFAARRPLYYALTYHGRLTPTWMAEGFHGQVGYGGGMLCQVHVPGKGQLIASTLNGSYGKGMHLADWRNFHLHTLVGTTVDGQPFVGGNSEHLDAALVGTTVTSSGEVRQSSLRVERRYAFNTDSIECDVRLAPSGDDEVYNLYGGRPPHRGAVTEAYEMIPYADIPVKRRRRPGKLKRTRVLAIDADGIAGAALTKEETDCAGVIIDRHGYGCRIIFDRSLPVKKGKNDTLLVVLASERTPAVEVSLRYTIRPYLGALPVAKADE